MSESLAVVALHVTAGVLHPRHGNAAACDRLGVEKARTTIDVHSACHVANVVQTKVPPLVPRGSWPLVLVRKGLENDVLVPLVVYYLSHFLEKVTTFVQNEKEVGRILAGLHLRVDEVLMACPSGFLSEASEAVVFLGVFPPAVHAPLPSSPSLGSRTSWFVASRPRAEGHGE